MAATNWMPDCRRVPTGAYGGYGNIEADTVVCHSIEGWRTTMDEWASEKEVVHQASYHFVIDRDGTITQYVPVNQAAWHAGRVDATTNPSVGVPWTGYRGVNPNSHTIGIGAEGFSGKNWTLAQHNSCIAILKWLTEQHNIIIHEENLIGHCDISPMTRPDDPGDNWDKELLLGAAKEKLVPEPIKKGDLAAWTNAWLSSPSTPIRYEGGYEVHQIQIPRRK